MNLVIIYGEIITNIEFRFIYDRYSKHREKHTSIAKCRVRLLDGNEVEIYGHDDIADKMFKFYQCGSKALIEGKLDPNMNVNIKMVILKNFREI